MIYYVSLDGNDLFDGTAEKPFRTINKAAKIAVAGDTVRVGGGVYRERVSPKNGGLHNGKRVVYEAVEGERPIIKGSEIVSDWERIEPHVWKKSLPNSFFGDFNPFERKVNGDWFIVPDKYDVHLGDVYLNGISMYEAPGLDDLREAKMRYEGQRHCWKAKLIHPEQSVYQWYADVRPTHTDIYCNFGEYDPNRETVEINVRETCFFPENTNVNYITVRGFEMAHAATGWAPPTAEQIGMIGPNWSKGWIIENNILHDSKCSAVSLGKEITTGQNLHFRFRRKSGYQYQQEAVFLALRAGWSKDTVGSHVVRNNIIYNCGQAGIVGHMGGAFSRIEHNHIYSVNQKQEFCGWEVAGIKLHAAIDTVIKNNNIHDCNLGLWLDWQAQGTRVTKNLFFKNVCDIFIEVTHGPCLVDNNILLSPHTLQEASQGSAYVHNIIAGPMFNYPTLDRSTPYHYPHSTDVAGFAFTYGGDYRFINNMVIGAQPCSGDLKYPDEIFEKYSTPEEYMPTIFAAGPCIDHDKYFNVPQPVWVEENAYSDYAKPYSKEISPITADGMDVSLDEKNGEWILNLKVPANIVNASCREVTTDRLGTPRISEAQYESPDGTPIDFSVDMIGNIRKDEVIPGALSELCEGMNKIIVWRENKI